MVHSSDFELMEEEDEEEVLNARGIKWKNPPGRPKNQKVGRHGRYMSVFEIKNCGISKSSINATAKKEVVISGIWYIVFLFAQSSSNFGT